MSRLFGLGLVVSLGLLGASPSSAAPPAQRLPSAFLVYQQIEVEGGGAVVDTRVEIVNLTNREQRLKCIYVHPPACFGTNFFVTLTPNQPLSWLASRGTFNTISFTAVPPFHGTGELKCVVIPDQDALDQQNAVQGRAVVFGADGHTAGYGAVGFRRLTPGEFSTTLHLDGVDYAQCPDEHHFVFIASEPGDPATQSEIVMAPCTEDLENVLPTTTTVQFVVVNEFEQLLSASTTVTCYERETLSRISHIFTRDTLGTETGHMIVSGVQSPILAMVIDRFRTPDGAAASAANEPVLEGGRSATVTIP